MRKTLLRQRCKFIVAVTVRTVVKVVMSESQRSQRLRVPTEKGRLLKLGNLQQKRNKLSTLIYKELKEVDELIQCNNLPEATERASQIQKLFESYMTAHCQCQLLITNVEERSQEDGEADKVDRDVYHHRKHYLSWLSRVTLKCEEEEEQRRKRPENKSKSERSSVKSLPFKSAGSKASSKSLYEFQVKESDEQWKLEMESKKFIKGSRKSSKSLVSGRTASSKTSSRLQELQMKERARLAELEIEREFIEKQRQGEIKLEQLKVQCQIEKTRARMKVFEEESNNFDARQSVAKETKKLSDDIPHYDTFTDDYIKGLQPRNSTNNYENEIVEMLKLSQAPTVDLDVFDGNVIDFQASGGGKGSRRERKIVSSHQVHKR